MAKQEPVDRTFDIAGQEAVREEAERKAIERAALEADDLKWLMREKRGRRHVHRTLSAAGVWRSSFNTNALTMAFNEGNRNEGLALLAKVMEHCPDMYSQMLKEHSENE